MKLPRKGDDPLDTWPELYLGWTAAMFTLLVVLSIIGWMSEGACP